MITWDQKVQIKEIGLQYAKATFSDVGDNLVHPITNGGFSPHLYNRRHIITDGGIRIDWMVGGTVLGNYNYHDNEHLLSNMLVYPFKHQPCDAIVITSLRPNSSFWCFLPFTNKNDIVDEQFNLDANESFALQRGRLYISNVDLLINNNLNPALQPFACVYNTVSINPDISCKIASFCRV